MYQKRNRVERITITLTAEEKKAIVEAARMEDLTICQFLRALIFGKMKKERME